jgi:MinD-like ATPase involved in chromosome partitioning or flagellar assembly
VIGERVGVLLAAGDAWWEVEAVRALSGRPGGPVLLKRCVDLPDLLASALTGEARVAVVSAELPGLDLDSLEHLRSQGLAVVELAGDRGSSGLAADALLPAADLGRLADVVMATAAHAGDSPDDTSAAAAVDLCGVGSAPAPDPSYGRLVAVWGPTGAPGRTTVAVGIAAAAAGDGHDTLLVDADPFGGAVAQQLGVLDEVSGLLSVCRLANQGRLDREALAAAARSLEPGLRVLTGLPRPDRWNEVREAAFDALLETARTLCPVVVVDVGFDLEDSPPGFGGSGPRRNQMTLAAVARADQVVVVGTAEPVGLARLARGLVDLAETVPTDGVHVVVNRSRGSLGWGEREVRTMVEGFVKPAGIHFLPLDVTGADRAALDGAPVTGVKGSSLGRGLAELARALSPTPSRPGVRPRTAGRGR